MKHAVYIGGFGNGSISAEHVGNTLEGVLDTRVEEFTFSEAVRNPGLVRRVAQDAKVFTHSAGMMALVGARPQEIHAFNAPLPRDIPTMLRSTLKKTVYMHTPGRGIRSGYDIVTTAFYDGSAACELLVHPFENLRHLKAISKFDAITSAYSAQQSDVPTQLAYTENDLYFQLSSDDLTTAHKLEVPIAMLPGQHDELVLHPKRVLEAYVGTAAIR